PGPNAKGPGHRRPRTGRDGRVPRWSPRGRAALEALRSWSWPATIRDRRPARAAWLVGSQQARARPTVRSDVRTLVRSASALGSSDRAALAKSPLRRRAPPPSPRRQAGTPELEARLRRANR